MITSYERWGHSVAARPGSMSGIIAMGEDDVKENLIKTTCCVICNIALFVNGSKSDLSRLVDLKAIIAGVTFISVSMFRN